MLITLGTSILTLYFALWLGVAGLAKVERPFQGPTTVGQPLSVRSLLFSSKVSRLLGFLEIGLALALVLGFSADLVTQANLILFGLFLVFKVYLLVTEQGSKCGCFGAYELIAIDLESLISSGVILALAGVLVLFTHLQPTSNWSWLVAVIFLSVFCWLVLRMLWRRRIYKNLLRQSSLTSI